MTRAQLLTLLLVGPVLVGACSPKCPTCSSLTAKPLAPLPVAIAAPKLPCELPELPLPVQLVGMASPDGIVLTKSDAIALLAYLEGERAWIDAARVCLESQ